MTSEPLSSCPTCASAWVTEVRETDLAAPVPVLHRWEVRCAEGHAFRVASSYEYLGWGEARRTYAVHLPELVATRLLPGVVAVLPARSSCAGCSEPFQGGQAYVPGPEPRHLGCRS